MKTEQCVASENSPESFEFFCCYVYSNMVNGDYGYSMDPKTPPGVAAPGGLVCLQRVEPFGLCAAVMYHLCPTTSTGSN